MENIFNLHFSLNIQTLNGGFSVLTTFVLVPEMIPFPRIQDEIPITGHFGFREERGNCYLLGFVVMVVFFCVCFLFSNVLSLYELYILRDMKINFRVKNVVTIN